MFAIITQNERDDNPWTNATIAVIAFLPLLILHTHYTRPSWKNPNPPYLSIWWFEWACQRFLKGRSIVYTKEDIKTFSNMRHLWYERWITAPAPLWRFNVPGSWASQPGPFSTYHCITPDAQLSTIYINLSALYWSLRFRHFYLAFIAIRKLAFSRGGSWTVKHRAMVELRDAVARAPSLFNNPNDQIRINVSCRFFKS
jgi:hypothetical protein